MIIDKNGNIQKAPESTYKKVSKSRKNLEDAKKISSIFIDNSTKTEDGYLFTRDNMNTTVNRLIKYLKQNT